MKKFILRVLFAFILGLIIGTVGNYFNVNRIELLLLAFFAGMFIPNLVIR